MWAVFGDLGVLVLTLVATAGADAPGAQDGALRDVGIFSDLDASVHVTLPRALDARATRLRLDDARRVLVLYEGEFPLKVFALASVPPAGAVTAAALLARLRPDDARPTWGGSSRTTPPSSARARPTPTATASPIRSTSSWASAQAVVLQPR